MKLPRVALGIRAQLLLVLTVFLAIPWLGYAYIRELEGVLRDAQERTLGGTAQAVATALHDRPRLFDAKLVAPGGRDPVDVVEEASARPSLSGSATDLEQILQGLTRTTAFIRVVDREQNVLARAGTLKRALPESPPDTGVAAIVDRFVHPLYAWVLAQPTEDFHEDPDARAMPARRDVAAALDGVAASGRRATSDGLATIVAATHPIWVGDRVRGAVVVEETTNAVLAERNRAFARLFDVVLATLLIGSVALTLYATRLTARIRRLRDDAEAAIDAQGRVRGALPGSTARDEIGDLARSFSSVLARLGEYAADREQLAGRLSHELRTPLAIVRSSLDNLRQTGASAAAGVYIERAQGGLDRLTHILTRMGEAARLEHALTDTERVRFDVNEVVAGCVDGYRAAYPQQRIDFTGPGSPVLLVGAPELVAQMLDKLVANAVEFATAGPIIVTLVRDDATVRVAVANEGPPLPNEMDGRLFDSMVSVRPAGTAGEPHLGLGLYIVRLIAEFHGGSVRADNRDDGRGVVVTVTLPLPSTT